MVSAGLAAALARRNIHYGWVVVAVTFLTMLVTAGAMGAPGVLIVPLEREFGWDNAQISQRAGASPAAVRVVRSVRRGVHEPLRAAPGHDLRGGPDCRRTAGLAGDDAGVATGPAVGLRRRRRHRPYRHRSGGHRGDALVYAAPRPGRRPAHGEFGDRSTGLPAADRGTDRTFRLARSAGFCLRPVWSSPRCSRSR